MAPVAVHNGELLLQWALLDVSAHVVYQLEYMVRKRSMVIQIN